MDILDDMGVTKLSEVFLGELELETVRKILQFQISFIAALLQKWHTYHFTKPYWSIYLRPRVNMIGESPEEPWVSLESN